MERFEQKRLREGIREQLSKQQKELERLHTLLEDSKAKLVKAQKDLEKNQQEV